VLASDHAVDPSYQRVVKWIRTTPAYGGKLKWGSAYRWIKDVRAMGDDEDININMSTSTPAAPSPAQAPSSPVQAPPLPPGPVTRARARELNYIMLLKNEDPEE
jgi:hypothetical protein